MRFIRTFVPVLIVVSMLLAACAPAAPSPTTAPAPPAKPAAQPTTAPQAAAKTVKIGLSAPLTGDLAQNGLDFRNGVEIGIQVLNETNAIPGYKFELVAQDSKGDPKEAANVAQKFAAAKDVLAVVGDYASAASLAAAPIYQQASILMISPTSSHPDLLKTGNFIFRDVYNATFEANAVADWAKDLGLKKMALVGRNDDYGKAATEAFAVRAKENGIQVVTTELFNPTDKDYKPLITKIRSLNPDGLFFASFQVETALFLQQAKEMGLKATGMSGAALFNPLFLQQAGDAAEGFLVVSSFLASDPNPAIQQFVKLYRAKNNNQDPSKNVAHAYVAVMMVADAIKRANGVEPAKVRDALTVTKDMDSIIGKINLDKDREMVVDLKRLVIKSKDYVLWTKS